MHFNDVHPEIWERTFKTTQERMICGDKCDDLHCLSNWHKSMLLEFLVSNKNMFLKLLLRKAINVLSSFSLVNEQTNGTLNMHPLAHAWARDRPAPKNQIQAWTRSAIVLSFATGCHGSQYFLQTAETACGFLHTRFSERCLEYSSTS